MKHSNNTLIEQVNLQNCPHEPVNNQQSTKIGPKKFDWFHSKLFDVDSDKWKCLIPLHIESLWIYWWYIGGGNSFILQN